MLVDKMASWQNDIVPKNFFFTWKFVGLNGCADFLETERIFFQTKIEIAAPYNVAENKDVIPLTWKFDNAAKLSLDIGLEWVKWP